MIWLILVWYSSKMSLSLVYIYHHRCDNFGEYLRNSIPGGQIQANGDGCIPFDFSVRNELFLRPLTNEIIRLCVILAFSIDKGVACE